MIKTIGIIVFIVLLAAWIAWDQFAKWNWSFRGDCDDHWFEAKCSRCGYSEIHLDGEGLEAPKKCPRCGRRMR